MILQGIIDRLERSKFPQLTYVGKDYIVQDIIDDLKEEQEWLTQKNNDGTTNT